MNTNMLVVLIIILLHKSTLLQICIIYKCMFENNIMPFRMSRLHFVILGMCEICFYYKYYMAIFSRHHQCEHSR